MKETVIQFGEGNFLRGFFDYFLDIMNSEGLYDGKAVVIQPRAGGKCELLNRQNCMDNTQAKKTLQMKNVYCVKSITRMLKADVYHWQNREMNVRQ